MEQVLGKIEEFSLGHMRTLKSVLKKVMVGNKHFGAVCLDLVFKARGLR